MTTAIIGYLWFTAQVNIRSQQEQLRCMALKESPKLNHSRITFESRRDLTATRSFTQSSASLRRHLDSVQQHTAHLETAIRCTYDDWEKASKHAASEVNAAIVANLANLAFESNSFLRILEEPGVQQHLIADHTTSALLALYSDDTPSRLSQRAAAVVHSTWNPGPHVTTRMMWNMLVDDIFLASWHLPVLNTREGSATSDQRSIPAKHIWPSPFDGHSIRDWFNGGAAQETPFIDAECFSEYHRSLCSAAESQCELETALLRLSDHENDLYRRLELLMSVKSQAASLAQRTHDPKRQPDANIDVRLSKYSLLVPTNISEVVAKFPSWTNAIEQKVNRLGCQAWSALQCTDDVRLTGTRDSAIEEHPQNLNQQTGTTGDMDGRAEARPLTFAHLNAIEVADALAGNLDDRQLLGLRLPGFDVEENNLEFRRSCSRDQLPPIPQKGSGWC